MLSEENSPKNDIHAENIFDDFQQDQWEEDIQNPSKEEKLYDYLSYSSRFFTSLNIILLLTLLFAYTYIFIQTQEEKKTYNFLSPFCQVFLWDVYEKYAGWSCHNLYGSRQEVLNNIEIQKNTQGSNITPILSELYGLENFHSSKKVLFLLERSAERMRPLTILQEFDTLKNTYSPVDKSELQCYDIEFFDSTKMRISCDAYSSDWDTAIAGLKNGVLLYNFEGSSITRASAFMDYIENADDSPFILLSKTENLSYSQSQKSPYTQKTSFQLELEYISHDLAL